MNHYEGVELSKERIFVYAKKSALQEIISAISKRFSEFCDEPAGVVTATRIADMKAWPISWDTLKGINLLKKVFKKVNLLSLFLCFYSLTILFILFSVLLYHFGLVSSDTVFTSSFVSFGYIANFMKW